MRNPLTGILAGLLCLANLAYSQGREFEVLSVKAAGTDADHETREGQNRTVHWQPPELKGTRFSADAPLTDLIVFAFLPILTASRDVSTGWMYSRTERPDWMRFEYYKIDARTPAGTNLEGAREMLRNALIKRLGLQYHLTDRPVQVYNLVRSGAWLKLKPSSGPPPPGPQRNNMWVLHAKEADLAGLAHFLTSVAGREVVDKTGIQGKYEFDLDWSAELHQGNTTENGFGVANSGIKSLGLKLEPAKETRKFLIVDRANKMPTPN